MKIVVTGALGHIGSHLIRDLPIRFPGAEIVMIDSMMTQRYPSLFNLPEGANFQFIEGDVTAMDLRPIVAGADGAVSLAAITDATSSFDRAEEVERNNYEATRQLAEACLEEGVGMIFPSSTSVYGTQAEVVDENCTPEELKPQSPYAETKLLEEEWLSKKVDSGLKVAMCRFGTIYGTSPGMRFHTAVNKFCWQAVLQQPLTVWETAYEQKRPYLDVADCSRSIAFFIENQIFDGRVYNVVTANHTVKDVVDTIRKYAPDLEVELVSARIMNQLSYEVLNTNLKTHDFTFEGGLDTGIRETIEVLSNMNYR